MGVNIHTNIFDLKFPLLLLRITKISPNWTLGLVGVAHLVHGFVASTVDADVDHGVLQGSAHVELQGEIVNSLERGDMTSFQPAEVR